MAEPQSPIEIPISELEPYAPHFRDAVEVVCESRFFRSSPKSCEFLRHIVHRTLEGNTNELKERLIGMSLFGRVATYDTGSDATVRVRANDVRKRLTAYNEAQRDISKSCLELPAGSYVPRFYKPAENENNAEAAVPSGVTPPVLRTQLPQLNLQQLATPTLCALFLCVIFLRWQIAQEHPFNTFWQGVFQSGHVSLYLPTTADAGTQPLLRLQQVQMSSPLLNLAGQFHSKIAVVDTPQILDGDLLIIVHGPPQHHQDSPATSTESNSTTGQLAVEDTPDGTRIVQRNNPRIGPVGSESAALLTLARAPHRRIEIEGTDNNAIQNAVRLICERDVFPEILADNNQSDGTTQVILPTAPEDRPILFHNFAMQASTQ
jgi:hypothetical protein